MRLTVGSRLGTYEIQSPLGAGGMGEVYRATDTKLGRDVAVKVLPAEMAHDSERLGRFRREAKALAQIDHPNIVTIYSVEESDGVHFLTMQLVDGQPLDRLIARGGLPFERIVEIGSALAEALAAAHEKGIVHRDLKPANVMVGNEGRIKVLDFGLAKDVRGGNAGDATLTSASHTEAGMVMGTPAYMSPEQVSGRTLDHRTDIFSFGVLLHEMAAGQRPFEGESTAELISSILRDTPPPVTDLRADLPADLARVIRRCLEKDPRHRVQTARDLGNEFRDMARAVTGSMLISTSAGRAHAVDSGAANADEGFWVAVLPFRCGGASADLTALAEALSEEVVTGLSRFSYLKVVARGSAARFAGQPVDVRDAGKELNARYVLEGTLRQACSRLRLSVQLADVVSGAHLWAESYERAFSPDSVFELQDDLVPRIVSTVADMNGVLPRSMSEGLRSRSPEQLSPYEAVLRSFYYCTQGTAEELAAARSGLEMAVRRAPASSDAWAMLAFLCCQDYVHGFNLQADSLNAGVAAGRRAVETGPSNHLAHFSLAQALFMQKEYQAFRNAAERTVTLNPMDGNSMAFLGELLTYARDEIRGIELAQRAKQLNPNHPGWYWYADFYNAYRQGDYQGALEFALKVNMPSHYAMYLMVAATCGQLGEYDQAAKALRELLRMRPDIASILRLQAAKVWNPEYSDRFLEGLRKAGLEIPEDGAASSRELPASAAGTRAKRESGAARSTEGFWVAVLPFRHGGGDPNLAALADGLTDDIVTNMSKFSYLRVVARSSTAQYAQGTVDVRTAAKELGARYVVEGSIRQAGAKVRIAAQLVDAGNGASLWAETYDRTLAREAMLDLLDDVVSRIVATVGDTQGILAHSMTEALRNRAPESLTPHEALLRSFGFHQHVSEAEHLAGRTALERAVKQAPDHADCWAMLSWLFRAEYTYGYNPLPDPMGRSLAAARRAVDLAPSNQLAQAALASAFFFRRELPAFRSTAERALTLNHVVGYTTAFLGMHFAYSGDWERGCALAERSTQLNPHHPGWYWFPMVLDAYRRGDGKRAMEYVLRINMPGLWTAQVALAVVNSQLGQMEQARIALRDLLAIRPDFAAKAREELGIWWQPEMVEQMLGDLCKAGLGTPDAPVAPLPASGTAPVQTASGETRAAEGFWVAVLPFKCTGGSSDLAALADGLTDDIVTGLNRFSFLRVIARSSAARYANEAVDVRAAAKELGARYVLEGSVRQSGARVRIAAQLVDAGTGVGLWAETWDRAFSPDTTLDLLDDVVPRIVSTCADPYGVLARSISDSVRGKAANELTPYEALLRGFAYHQRLVPDEHLKAREALEHAVEKDPGNSDCWAMLAWVYAHEHGHGFNPRPGSLDRSLAAARRAVDLAPANHLAHQALSTALFFRKDLAACLHEADCAIELNPVDGGSNAAMGAMIAFAGDWDRGIAMIRRAMALNAQYPFWCRSMLGFNEFRQAKYEAAVATLSKSNAPELFYTQMFLAAAYAQLGDNAAAASSLHYMRRLRADLDSLDAVGAHLDKWFQREVTERVLDGLRKAGLRPAGDSGAALAASAPARPSIAVLPFANLSADPEQDYFSDGLAEEIINLLAQVSGLKVIARTSAFAFRGKEQDIRGIAEALGVGTVLEGSVRRSGSRIRVTVQLIAAEDGAHLWSERYDREMSDIFAVQDEISQAVAKALRVRLSPHAVSQRYTPRLAAYEVYLKARHHEAQVTPESLELARRCYEQACELDSAFGMARVGLGVYWLNVAYFGRHPARQCMAEAQTEVRRALQIDPSLPDAHALLGYLAAMNMDWATAGRHFDSPMARQASIGAIRSVYSGFLYLRGNAEEAIRLAERAIEEDPLDVWAHMNLHAYLQAAGRDAEALDQLKRVLELDQNQVVAMVSMAMIYADRGHLAEALKIARRGYATGPWFPDTIGVLAALLRRNGNEEEAKSIANELGSGEAAGDARGHALFHLLSGELDEGADWVEKAIEERDPSMMFYLRFVVCRGLKASHRWRAIAKLTNLPA